MKRLWTVPVSGMLIFLVAGCGNFGIAGHPNDSYTTHYNYPGTRVAPYNDPNLDYKAYPDEVQVCTGIPSKRGFHCR